MWTPLYTGHFGLVPKVSAFRGSTVFYASFESYLMVTFIERVQILAIVGQKELNGY